MALTPSNMLKLGTVAPDFTLPNVLNNTDVSLQEIKGQKATIIMFICAHCPYVIHVENKISDIARMYAKKGIQCIAISSNDVKNHPDDAPEKLKAQAEKCNFIFPYLYDETQEVAKAYKAACTPDFYLFNDTLKLVYRGRMDASTPGNGEENTGEDLINAIENILQNKPQTTEQLPSMGCGIKWKS